MMCNLSRMRNKQYTGKQHPKILENNIKAFQGELKSENIANNDTNRKDKQNMREQSITKTCLCNFDPQTPF